MNKENMAEQQENKDWLDKLGEFFSKIFINPNKDIAYSIRKRATMKLKFGIPFLMGMPVDLFVLF